MGFLGTPPKNVRDIAYYNHTNYGALMRQVNVSWKNDPTLPDYYKKWIFRDDAVRKSIKTSYK